MDRASSPRKVEPLRYFAICVRFLGLRSHRGRKPCVDPSSRLRITAFKWAIQNWISPKNSLRAIGRVAMAFNEVENHLFLVFSEATGLNGQLLIDIFSRINGVDGVIAIINAGARNLGLNESESSALGITLGEGVFKKLKKCRDSVIHAISHNALAGIGLQRERQGRFNETLMTEEALGRLYRHLMALRAELSDVITLAFIHQHFASLPDGDPNKALAETDRSDCSAQFLAHRNLRQALPPLPEFPEESELLSVRDAWLRRICVLEPPPDE